MCSTNAKRLMGALTRTLRRSYIWSKRILKYLKRERGYYTIYAIISILKFCMFIIINLYSKISKIIENSLITKIIFIYKINLN